MEAENKIYYHAIFLLYILLIERSKLMFAILSVNSKQNKLFLVVSLVFAVMLITAAPSLVHAQDPFTFGNFNDPFTIGGGGGTAANSNSNTTLQVRSDTDWSGIYGDSTGSTTVDGHGNRNISFACSNTYSADFQKKGEGPGFLTLNIVQPINHVGSKPQVITRNGVPIEPGGSVNVTKQITDLVDFVEFDIYQVSNSSSNAVDTNKAFNSTLRETITDPNGRIVSDNDTGPQTAYFFPIPPPNPDIAGKYTFSIKNFGDSPVNVRIQYGSPPSKITTTTQNTTNTRTTTAQFGTVSVSGSC